MKLIPSLSRLNHQHCHIILYPIVIHHIYLSRLKTYLFHKSFPPQEASTFRTAIRGLSGLFLICYSDRFLVLVFIRQFLKFLVMCCRLNWLPDSIWTPKNIGFLIDWLIFEPPGRRSIVKRIFVCDVVNRMSAWWYDLMAASWPSMSVLVAMSGIWYKYVA